MGIYDLGVARFIKASEDLERQVEEMRATKDKLKSTFDENRGGLGAHDKEIEALLNTLGLLLDEKGRGPVLVLRKKLLRLARARQRHIDRTLGDGNTKGRSR